MKKLLIMCLILFVSMLSISACNNEKNNDPTITVSDDGYLMVNGEKTEHKVETEDDNKIPEEKPDIIEVVDGYLVVNGEKTEYKVHTEPIISIIDGYVAVNGEKTEYKVHTEPIISIIDGYVAVNGVKTEYLVAIECNHIWNTVTTAPTCTSGGYDTMTCPLCDKSVQTNETAPIAHTYETTYSFNDDYHWFKCIGCDDAKDKAEHTLDDGVCTVCDKPVSATPGVIYDISSDGTYAEVVGYDGTAQKVKIASEYKGLPVKNIYDEAFYDNDTIREVIIPNSVTCIGDEAFFGCLNLASVVIPDSVTSIGDYAFCNCSILTSIEIGNSVSSIGDYAFWSCWYLASIEIGNSVSSIGNGAFEGCERLASIVIPDSVTSIGDSAFSYCERLASIVIPDSVTRIGENAFYGCPKLMTEYEHCEYVGSEDNPYKILISTTKSYLSSYTIHEDTKVLADGAFSDCERLAKIVIPDSVTSIGYSAFSGCSSLTSVVIPDSVTRIGKNAFYGCRNLKIFCEAETKPADWDPSWNYYNIPVVWGYKE